jgi:hypothetical protein
MTDIVATSPRPTPDKSIWLFHLVRIIAAAWGAWILLRLAMLIINRPQFLELQSKAFGIDVTGVSDARFYGAFALAAVVFFGATVLAWCIWSLFSTFLDGRGLSYEATCRMRTVGVVGLVVTLIDIGYRPIFYWVLNDGLFARVPWSVYFRSDDLLHLLLATMVIAFAIVYRRAVEPRP